MSEAEAKMDQSNNVEAPYDPLSYKNIAIISLLATLVFYLSSYVLSGVLQIIQPELFTANSFIWQMLIQIIPINLDLLLIFSIYFLYLCSRRIDLLRIEVLIPCLVIAVGALLLSKLLNGTISYLLYEMIVGSQGDWRRWIGNKIYPILLTFMGIVFGTLLYGLLCLFCNRKRIKRAKPLMFTLNESRWILILFAYVLSFYILKKGLYGEFYNVFDKFNIRISIIISTLFTIFVFLLNTLIIYYLTPVTMKSLRFTRAPQLFKATLTFIIPIFVFAISISLAIYLLIISGEYLLLQSSNSDGRVSILWLIGVSALFVTLLGWAMLLDCFRVFDSKAFLLFFVLQIVLLFILLVYLMQIDNLEWVIMLSKNLFVMFLLLFCMIPALLAISSWVGLGSIQLAIHQIYKKSSDEYNVSEQRFYKSIFARLFVPLTRWI